MSLNAVYAYLILLLLISLYGVFRYKNLTPPFKYLAVILLVTLISESLSILLAIKIRNSCPPYHAICILQYAGFSLIYAKLITNRHGKRFIKYSIIPFTLLSIINTTFIQHINTVPSYMIMLSYIIFIVYALILFMQMLNEPKETAIVKQGIFWFNCAMLIYSVLSSVSLGVIDYLIKHKLFTFPLHVFLYYITVLYYLTLGISLYLDDKRDRMSST